MSKALILLTLTLISLNLRAIDQSNTKNDSLYRLQQKEIVRQDSLIKSLQLKVAEVDIQKTFFSNEITILTTIFSLIVAISIFIMGFLIPHLQENKYKSEVLLLRNEFNAIKKEIVDSQEKIKNEGLWNQMVNARAMFYISSKYPFARFLWALRFLNYSCDYEGVKFAIIKNEEFLIDWYPEDYLNMKKELKTDQNNEYFKQVEEVNNICKKLSDAIKDESIIKKIDTMKVEFNKMIYSASPSAETTQ